MTPRPVNTFDRVVIGICLLWILGWMAAGLLVAAEIYWGRSDAAHARQALAAFGMGAAIGSIALIALWPHRWLLRRDERQESGGHGFEVKR